MNSYQQLWQQLIPLYDETEAKALVRTLLEVRYGLSFTDIVCGKVNELSADDHCALQKMIHRLQQAEPVQYILGETMFCNRRFSIKPGVLIPRSETEELCKWIIDDNQNTTNEKQILDIGTGSGCIAITLALAIKLSCVTAWDISTEAIKIANKNVSLLGAKVNVQQQDVMKVPNNPMKWDIIVSNPPYICPSEIKEMHPNVLQYEPHTALFVPEDKPLLFYEKIAQYAYHSLKPNGKLYFEINPLHVEELIERLKNIGFIDIKVKQDAFGKQRMVRAITKF